jgi:hypothetical protein
MVEEAKFNHLAYHKEKVYDQDLISMVVSHRSPLGEAKKQAY